MDKYVLYLDESETFTNTRDFYFAIGGVIIKESAHDGILTTDLNALKEKLWNQGPISDKYVLHEKEISEVHSTGRTNNACYNIFKKRSTYNTLYIGLSNILTKHDITTVGVCLNEQSLIQLYPGETNNKLTIALQMLLENYCHFLMRYNGVGDICYESLQDNGNQELRQRFYELEALGTMYYTPHFFQTHIGDIKFPAKSENLAGLQLADFIPNTLARTASGSKPKHDAFKKTVLKQAYDGGIGKRPKYGLKVIP